jgi:predicted O-methyltransferase YrrM
VNELYEFAMELSRPIAAISAMIEPECEALFNACMEVPIGGTVIEVGCQLGRSSCIILAAAKQRDFFSYHIDPYYENPEYGPRWLERVMVMNHPFALLRMRTGEALPYLSKIGLIDLAFVDGDHSYEAVKVDMQVVASKIRSGGLLLAHDCGHVHFPGVLQAIREYTQGWTDLGITNSLGMWKRP